MRRAFFNGFANRNVRRACYVYFAWLGLCALALSLPVASILNARTKELPGAARELFTAGGYILGEILRIERVPLGAALELTTLAALIASGSRLVPLTGLVVALRHKRPLALAVWVRRGAKELPRQLRLTGAALLLLLLCALFFAAVQDWLARFALYAHEEPTRDAIRAAVCLLLLLPALLVQPFVDLSRCSPLGKHRRVRDALIQALETFAKHPVRIALNYSLFWLSGYGAVGVAAWTAHHVTLDGDAWVRQWLGAVIHLLGLAALTFCRVCWLSRAHAWMRAAPAGDANSLVPRLRPSSPDGTAARSDAPAAPSRDPAS